jgi:hypothetical protein
MLDPTAYDNKKVVTEGAAYDLDLEGLASTTILILRFSSK